VRILLDRELIITSGREVIVQHSLAGEEACCLRLIFPHLGGLQVGKVEDGGDAVLIMARSRAAEAACHRCGASSARARSRYLRRLHDLAAGGRAVMIDLEVRRFFCGNAACGLRTFAGQVPAVALRHQRRDAAAAQRAGSGRAGTGRPGRVPARGRAGRRGLPGHADPADPRSARSRDYRWHLRKVMADRGMFSTTDLIPLLADRGIVLSSSQVYRLVVERPERLSLKILMALLDILDCTMDDLIEPVAAPGAAQRPGKAAAGGTADAAGVGALRPKRARITGTPP
jgi:DNA-binding Xre family transcriptional regulator